MVKYWPEEDTAGFIVWRYLLRRDDPAPAPWTEEGRRRIEEGGWGEIRKPENYEEGQAEKLKAKAAKFEEKEKSSEKKSRGKKRNYKDEEEIETKAKISKTVPVARFKIPADILKAMDQDKINKRLWDEVRGREYVTRKDLVDNVETHVQCEFCFCIVSHPVTMECSHSFCKSCIKRAFKAEHFSCSSCRADLQDAKLEVNQEMRACLLLIFPGYEN